MFSILLTATAGITLSYMFAVRTGVLQPSTVDPFLPTGPGISDPSSDTMVNGNVDQTRVPLGNAGWQTTTLKTLTAVEEFLDCLENHNFAEREVLQMGNNCFAVRWR